MKCDIISIDCHAVSFHDVVERAKYPHEKISFISVYHDYKFIYGIHMTPSTRIIIPCVNVIVNIEKYLQEYNPSKNIHLKINLVTPLTGDTGGRVRYADNPE